jgi:hypothetical protein
MDGSGVILIVIVALLIAAAALWLTRRSKGLKERFGPEYEKTVSKTGSQWRAESELQQRQERHGQLDIRPLDPDRRNHYLEAWRAAQARFVDAPSDAIKEADGLVQEVMAERGYPINSFEQRASDISVDHSQVVSDYRAAHDISLANEEGEASTDDLRQAMVHYRSLFEDLLETHEDDRTRRGS